MWRRVMLGSCAVALGISWACVGSDPAQPPAVDNPDAATNPTDATTTQSDSGSPGVDSAIPDDGGCTSAMPFTRFGAIPEVNTATNEYMPRLTPDERVMYFTQRDLSFNFTSARVTRDPVTAPFGSKTAFFPDSVKERIHVWPATDESHVYYAEEQGGGVWQLATAKLNTDKTVDGTTAKFLTALNGPAAISNELTPFLTQDESQIWWASDRQTAANSVFDIFTATKVDGGFASPHAAPHLNSTSDDNSPVVSADMLTIYFASGRARTFGVAVWMATRAAATDDFGDPVLAPGLEALEDETAPQKGSANPGWISPDNCRLYLTTTKDNGSQDIYVASRR
jgi:hypothetical protein